MNSTISLSANWESMHADRVKLQDFMRRTHDCDSVRQYILENDPTGQIVKTFYLPNLFVLLPEEFVLPILDLLIEKGAIWNSYDGSTVLRYCTNLQILKHIFDADAPSICQWSQDALRSAVTYSNDEVLEWVNNKVQNNGYGIYAAAVLRGALNRFKWLIDHNIPMDTSTDDLWKALMDNETSKSWLTHNPEGRDQIRQWCLENNFHVDHYAVGYAIRNYRKDIYNTLLKTIQITDFIMESAVTVGDIDLLQQLYDIDRPLYKDLWYSTQLGCDQILYQWLLDHNCPKPKKFIATRIGGQKGEPLERLQWYLDNGFTLSRNCWHSAAHIYRGEARQIMQWLWDNKCPADLRIVEDEVDSNSTTFIELMQFLYEHVPKGTYYDSENDNSPTDE